ncbi:hypothetical protein ACF0H5_007830 [Mactra antiquata]
MASMNSIQSSDSSFSDPLTVPPWKVLVDNICDNLDERTFEKFIYFSKDKLGTKLYNELAESKSYVKYFSCLEDLCGENDAVDHIEHIVSIDRFHGNLGETNYSEEIRKYRQEKIRYLEECAKKGLTIDSNFVGRELIIEDIFGYLRGEYKGVLICGMGGIGKTSLAGQICFKMKYDESKWIIIPVSLREVKSCGEFLEQLVASLDTELNVDDHVLCTDVSTSNLKCQLQSLLYILNKDQKNILFLIDNIDGMVDSEVKKHEFDSTMCDILKMISSNVKFLLTSRMKISNVTDHANEKAFLFNKSMVEIELKSLNEDNTTRMLRKLSNSNDKTLPEEACNQLFALCDGIPLAISMIAGQIKDGFPVQRLIGYMQSQPRDSLINNVISNTLKKMESTGESLDLKNLLVRLSVFHTASFDIKACTDICRDKQVQEREKFGYSFKDKTEEDRRWVQLAKLKSLFLLEIDHVIQFRHRRDHVKKSYSLHPMVYEYLNHLCRTDDGWNHEREVAKQNFVEYFGKLIQKRGEKFDKSSIEVRQFIETSKPHIKNWFFIIRKEKCSLRKYLNGDNPSKTHLFSCHCIMKVARLVISHHEKVLFATVQAVISKSEKDLYSYIYWKSVESECKININRLQLAEEILDDLSTELGIVSNGTQCNITDWNVAKEDEVPAWGKFYLVKSLLYHRLCQNEHKTMLLDRAQEVLNIADEIFSRKTFRKQYKTVAKCFVIDHADVKNLKGCICFLQKDLKSAMQYHQSAFDVVNKVNDKHSSLIEYLSNLAACKHMLGKQSQNDEERDRLFDEALRKYGQLVGMNKRLLQNKSLDQAAILRNRAELYFVQKRVDKALSDGKLVLEIVMENYVPPHIEITLATERLAHYHLKIGKEKKKEMDKEGEKHLERSVDCYDNVLHYIITGGLPLEHEDARTFNRARDNHKNALLLLKYSKKEINNTMRKYQEFLDGKYNQKIQKSLVYNPDFLTDEFLQECREKGLTFTPGRIVSDSESTETDSDDTDTETSSDQTSISDSNESSDSEKIDESENNLPVVTFNRRDSGIEEEDAMNVQDERKKDEHLDRDVDTLNRVSSNQNKEACQPLLVPCLQSSVSSQSNSRFQFQEKGVNIPCIKVQDFPCPSTSHTDKPKSVRKHSITRQENVNEIEMEQSMKLKRQNSIDESEMEFLIPTNKAFSCNKDSKNMDRKISEDKMQSTSFDNNETAPLDAECEVVAPSKITEGIGSSEVVASSPAVRKLTWSSYGSQDSTFGDSESCVSEIDSDSTTERRKHMLSSASSQGSVTSRMEHMLKLSSCDDKEDSNDSDGEPAPKLPKLDDKQS